MSAPATSRAALWRELARGLNSPVQSHFEEPMIAFQTFALPGAAPLLAALDGIAGAGPDAAPTPQFSELLAQNGGQISTQPAIGQAASGAAATSMAVAPEGKAPGKPGGSILPDGLAALAAPADDGTPVNDSPAGDATTADVLASDTAPGTVLNGDAQAAGQGALVLPLSAMPIPSPAVAPAESSQVAMPGSPLLPPVNGPVNERSQSEVVRTSLATASTAPASSTAFATHQPANQPATVPPVAAGTTATGEVPASPPHAAIGAPVAQPEFAIRIAVAPIPLAGRQLGLPDRLAPVGEAITPESAATAATRSQPSAQPAVRAGLALSVAGIASQALAQVRPRPGSPDTQNAAPSLPAGPMVAELAAEPAAAPEALAAQAPSVAPLPVGAAAVLGNAAPAFTAPVASPQALDFATLIDRLVEARQTARGDLAGATVETTINHADFGRVSLQFQQDADGMTVSLASADPDLARAVQSLSASASATPGDTNTGAQRGESQGSGAAASGQSQAQAQNQFTAQQRGQTSQRDGSPLSAQQHQSDEKSGKQPPERGGIFA